MGSNEPVRNECWSKIWNISYIELWMWNQVSCDPRSYYRNLWNCIEKKSPEFLQPFIHDHSLLDTLGMLSKLQYVREFCFFCFPQFELSHNLHLPTGGPLCNTKLIHYQRVNGQKLRYIGMLYWNYWDLKVKSNEWAMWGGVILVGSEQLGHCHSPTLWAQPGQYPWQEQ